MSDDFNTALAISFMFELAKEINIYHQHISTGSEKPDGKLVENMEKLFAESAALSAYWKLPRSMRQKKMLRLKTS